MNPNAAPAPKPVAEQPDNLPTPPLTVRVREACRLTGIGRSKLYELTKAGEVETIKVGHMTLIPMASLTTFLEAHRVASESTAGAPDTLEASAQNRGYPEQAEP